MTIQSIPLGQLVQSQLNARKNAGNGIAALATSIAAHGLLHNLTVLPAHDGMHQVIDGGRRLLALQQLVKKKKLASDFSVPCLVRDDAGHSTEISAAANAFTEPMHPADQCDAFRRMIDEEKATIADVAARFSVSELIVRQRLKLANVSPRLVDLYRQNKLNLDQMQALAISDDHAAQEHAFFDVKHDWERSGRELRERLTKKLVSTRDSRVQFVGLDAYTAAGGNVLRDLFAKQDEGFLDDTKLLDRLVSEKLAATEQQLRADGWSWVEIKSNLDYQARAEYAEVPAKPVARDATAEELAQLQQLHAREEPLLARFNELEQIDDRSDDQEEEYERLNEEIDGIEDARSDIDDARKDYASAVKAASGVLIELGPNGIQIHHARLKPGEKLKKGSLDVMRAKGSDAQPEKPKAPEFSESLRRRLQARRTAAMQALIAGDPEIALTALLHTLVVYLFYGEHFSHITHIVPLNKHEGLRGFDFLDVNKAIVDRSQQFADWKRKMPKSRGDLIAWLHALPYADRRNLLAACVALTADPYIGDLKSPAGAEFASMLELDMADHWQPTADAYLAHVPKTMLTEAVAEACGKTVAATLAPLKKDAAIAAACKHLAGTGWLPKPLRGPGYALKKPGAAPAAMANGSAKPKTKKGPKKKPQKKSPARHAVPQIPAQSRSAS